MILSNQTPPITYKGFHTFYGAFCVYRDICAQVWPRDWNNETQDSYEKIILKHIVPNLPDHDVTPIYRYTINDYAQVIENLRKNGKNGNRKCFAAYANETLLKYQHIIETVVKVASEQEFFPNVFTEASANNKQQIKHTAPTWKQVKSLSVDQEYAVSNYLLEHMREHGENIALYLMFALGLRNAEACGVNFGHIKQLNDYPDCLCLIVSQTTIIRSNELQIGGKTYNAMRIIPLPQTVGDLISELREQRIKILAASPNHDVSEIDSIPIAYSGKKSFVRCNTDAVCAAGRKMFVQLGMRSSLGNVSQYLQQDIATAEEDWMADEFAQIEKEPTAYLLRRNFATHLAILGLSESEIAYIIGHVIVDTQTKRNDFSDERDLYRIKLKMDARPILNKINHSPESVASPGMTIPFDRYSQKFVISKRPARIHIQAKAKEPADSIVITVKARPGIPMREEVSMRYTPYPHEFDSTVDILKLYHEAYNKKQSP